MLSLGNNPVDVSESQTSLTRDMLGCGKRVQARPLPILCPTNVPTLYRAYVTEIDHLIELLCEGAKSRLEVVSAITLFINGDGELTAKEKAQSFDLYMVEIEAVKTADSKQKSKGQAAGERTSKGEKLAQILATGKDNRKEEEPVDAESLSSTNSEEDETSRKRRKLRQSDMPWFG
jgi:hypothetical protein